MLPLSVAEIVQATQGILILGDPKKMLGGPAQPDLSTEALFGRGLSIDSRTLRRGDLFFALKGERADGHQFVNDSIRKGAAACVVSRLPDKLSLEASPDTALIKVRETRRALADCAAAYRAKYGKETRIVAVTGSTGKTTAKEMTAQILSRAGATVYSPGNFNNEVGCPLSLFSLQPGHRYGVFEIGASSRGEVQRLSEIVRPQAALLTNIGLEHTATFGTLEEIAEGESEVFAALSSGGAACLPRDDAFFHFLKSRALAREGVALKSFGLSSEADICACNLILWPAPVRFTLQRKNAAGRIEEAVDCTLPLSGRFNVQNACAAAAAAFALGVPAEHVRDALAGFKPPRMRFQILPLENGATIVNDTYNANPKSMRAALEAFIESFPHHRRAVVLGDMLELGEISRSEHYALGKFLAGLPLSHVLLYGPQSRFTLDGARDSFLNETAVQHCPDADVLLERVRGLLSPERAILFKSSRGMRLEEVIRQIAP